MLHIIRLLFGGALGVLLTNTGVFAQTATQRVLKNTSVDRQQLNRVPTVSRAERTEISPVEDIAAFVRQKLNAVRAANPIAPLSKTDKEGESASAEDQAPSFQLNRLRFDNSHYLPEELFLELNRQLAGRPINLAVLSAVPAIINDLYAQFGVLTGSSVLPPQTSKNGVIYVRLIEPVVGEIRVSNVGRTREDYITQRIRINSGEHPEFQTLAQDLFLFSTLNNMKLTARFEPTDRLGVVDVVLQGDTPKETDVSLSVDNHGPKTTGRRRVLASVQNLNLTGIRDILRISGDASEGLKRGEFSYSAPVGLRGARISLGGSYSESNVISGPLAITNLESQSLSGYASYQYPVVVEPDRIGWIGATGSTEHLTSQIGGADLTDTTINEGFLFSNWLWRRQTWFVAANIQLAAGEADSVIPTSTDGGFSYAQGSLDYSGALFNLVATRVKAAGLYNFSTNNPSSVQYSVGGVNTVRGYPETLLTGDFGGNASIEFSPLQPLVLPYRPEDPTVLPKVVISPYVFYDIGFAVPFRGGSRTVRKQDIIAGAGFGLRATIHEHLSAYASVSFPLRNATGFDASDAGPVFSFRITTKF